MNKELNLRFISDAGHGWLEVKLTDMVNLGVKPSTCSYVNTSRGIVYLEEDCDAGQFTLAAKAKGIKLNISEFYCNGNASLRQLPRWGGL